MNIRTASLLTAIVFLAAPLALVSPATAQGPEDCVPAGPAVPEGCTEFIFSQCPTGTLPMCTGPAADLPSGDSGPCSAFITTVADPLHAALCTAFATVNDSPADSDLDNDGQPDAGSDAVALTFTLPTSANDADEDGLYDRAFIGVWTPPNPSGPAVPSGYVNRAKITFQLDYFHTAAGENNPFDAVENGDAFDYSVTPMVYSPNGPGLQSNGNTYRLSTIFWHSEDARFGADTFALALYAPTLDGEGSCLVCISSDSDRIVFGGAGRTEGILDLAPAAGSAYPNQFQNGADLLFLDAPGETPVPGTNTFPDNVPLVADEIHVKESVQDAPTTSNIDDDANTDVAEALCGTNPTNPGAHCADYDGDGILNADDANPFTPDVILTLTFGTAPLAAGQEAPYTPDMKYSCSGPAGTITLQRRSDGGAWSGYKNAAGNDVTVSPCGVTDQAITGLLPLLNALNVDRNDDFRLVTGSFTSGTLAVKVLANAAPDVPVTFGCKTGQTVDTKDPCVDDNHNSDSVIYTYSVSPTAVITGEGQAIASVKVSDGFDHDAGEDGVQPLSLTNTAGTFAGEYAYPQGYGPLVLSIVIADTGGATFTNTANTLDVREKQASAVTLVHDPYADSEVDVMQAFYYTFYVKVQGSESPTGTFDFSNDGGWDDEQEGRDALVLVDCDDVNTFPFTVRHMAAGFSEDATLAASELGSYCSLEDPDYLLMYYTYGFNFGIEVTTYTFTVEGATSGPHVFDVSVYYGEGHFIPDVGGGDAPDPNDFCTGAGSFPTCMAPEDSPIEAVIGILLPECQDEPAPSYCADPTDQRDLRDTDGDSDKQETNGQLDLVEERLFYTKPTPDAKLDLYVVGGASALPAENARILVNDPEGDSNVIALIDAYAVDQALCIWMSEDGAQPLRVGLAANGDLACATSNTVWKQFNPVGTTVGNNLASQAKIPAGSAKPLWQVVDEDADSIPESIVINLIDPAGCAPSGTPPAVSVKCTTYMAPIVIPIGGVPDVDPCDVATMAPDCAPPAPLAANAGSDYSGATDAAIGITGSGSGGTAPYTCAWSSTGSAVFGNAAQCATTVTYATAGDYVLTLTVTDADSATAQDTANVNVDDEAEPTPLAAEAGGPYTGNQGAAITITGSGSGGTAPYSCAWTGTGATFANPAACSTTVTYSDAASHTVTLTVTDAAAATATDTATVTTSEPPSGPDLPGSGDPTSCFAYIDETEEAAYVAAWHECYTFVTGQSAGEGCNDPVFGFEFLNCVPEVPDTPSGIIPACTGSESPTSVYVCSQTTGGLLTKNVGLPGVRIRVGGLPVIGGITLIL